MSSSVLKSFYLSSTLRLAASPLHKRRPLFTPFVPSAVPAVRPSPSRFLLLSASVEVPALRIHCTLLFAFNRTNLLFGFIAPTCCSHSSNLHLIIWGPRPGSIPCTPQFFASRSHCARAIS